MDALKGLRVALSSLCVLVVAGGALGVLMALLAAAPVAVYRLTA